MQPWLTGTEDLELETASVAASEPPPPYNDRPQSERRPIFDWRRPATALLVASGVAVLAGVFYAIHWRDSLYANLCSDRPGPGPDYIHLLKGWMYASVGTVIWLLACLLSAIWGRSLQERMELPLLLATAYTFPLCIFMAIYGLFSPTNAGCFIDDGRFRSWMIVGLLPQMVLLMAVLAATLSPIVEVMKCPGRRRLF
jgi:hypothetical protein